MNNVPLRRLAVRHDSQTLIGHTTAAKPSCTEELEFVKAFSDALAHATAVVAADPDARPFPTGSIAERVRQAYSTFRPDERRGIGQRALACLSAPTEERRQYFGAYADADANTWYRADAGFNGVMKDQFKRALKVRFDAHRQDLEDALTQIAGTTYVGEGSSKTWVETGYFGGDMQVGWKTLSIGQPITLHFQWGTEAEEAERGMWQLFRVGFGKEILLASGPAGFAPGGTFDIALADFLQAQPPVIPAVYHVRVTPATTTKVSPGVMKGKAGPKIPGKAVGPASPPVKITYSGALTPPEEFQFFEIYRTADLTLDSIQMVVDQNGPGAEEFFIAGFVQETLPSSSTLTGSQQKFGRFYAELYPYGTEGPHKKSLPFSTSFDLNSPDSPEWPRAYTVVVSVLEIDDGGVP